MSFPLGSFPNSPVPGYDPSYLTTIVFGGNSFSISDEDAEEVLSRDGSSKGVRMVKCDWNHRIVIAAALLGGAQAIAGVSVFSFSQPFADFPAFQLHRITTKGDGLKTTGPNGMVRYQRAALTLNYKPANFDNQGIGFIKLDFTSSVMATDQTQPTYKWVSDSKPLPPSQTPTIPFSTCQISQERKIANLNAPLYASLQNKRNSTPIYGLPADTVLFRGATTQREISLYGTQQWTVDFSFDYNSYGWNKLYRPDTATFEAFKLNSGDDLFPPMDLNQLFA